MRRLLLIPLLIVFGLTTGCAGPEISIVPPQPVEGSAARSVVTIPTVTAIPTALPTTAVPTPTLVPTHALAVERTSAPVLLPTSAPLASPTSAPPASPTAMPTASPTSVPAPPEGAASAPTVAPEATSAGQRPVDIITVDAPKANAVVSSPLTISGSTNFWPFEASLAATLKDAAGNTLAIMPVMVQSPGPGTGGPFSEKMTFTAPARAQDGTLEVFEASAKDGSITSIARVKVRLVPAPAPGTTLQFDQPDEGALVSFPLHVAFGGARGDEKLTLRVVQAGAPPIAAEVQAQLGFVVATIPGNPAPGPATLEVARADGAVLARRALRIAAPAETQTVKVAWVGKDGQIALEERRVPRTQAIGAAALNELLWGPDPGGDTWGTSLPTPAEVLSFSGRAGSWGPRVRLLKLTIVNGVALANFSPELRAYGGGAARVAAIRQQIETTLRQFPSVKRVVIAVDGQTEGVLEP